DTRIQRYVTYCRSTVTVMGDTSPQIARDDQLFSLAESQAGYFTSKQAHDVGFSDDLIQYYLRHYPSSTHEDVMAAWLAVPGSVVSHDTALVLHDITDLIPSRIHLTVPRSKRNLPRISGVRIHTSSEPPNSKDVVVREGMRITSISRTIVDLMVANEVAPEHIEHAIRQALGSHLTGFAELEEV